MKRPTRILAAVGGVVALLLVLLLVLPLLFKDRIAQRVKLAVNQNLNARVDWRDVGVSFFRHFPDLTLTLDGLTAANVGKFQGDTLATMLHLGVSLDLVSVLGNVLGKGARPIVVRAIDLDQPRLKLVKLEDGTANWDISKKTTAAQPGAAAKPMAVSLQSFAIHDAAVAFDNRQAKVKALLSGFDQSLSGDFSKDLVGIRTKVDAGSVTVVFAGVPYLNQVRLGLDADVQADLAKKAFALKDTELRLNDLKLGLSGSAATAGRNTTLDLAFKAPSTDFRSILSLVPAVYAHDFDKVKTSGAIAVNGTVKGEYGDSAFPSFAINTRVENGAFQYPDLPLPARDIALDLSLTNPGGSPDSTLVNLRKFHLLVGGNPVDAVVTVRTPVSDPDVDARVSGKVNLADVNRTLKLEGFDQLTGTVTADAAVRTRMSAVKNKQYDRVAASGAVDIAGMTVKGKTLPLPLAIQQASLKLAPEKADLRSFKATIGSSDVQAAGSLRNLLGFMLRDDTLQGVATVRSNRFNLEEWRSGESNLQIIPVPPRIDFDLDASVAQLAYDKLTMTNVRGRLRIKDQRATLEDFRMNTLGGEIGVTGYYETTTPAKPTFDVGLKMTKVDIPAAFEAFTTVQALAPVAKYAIGTVNTDFRLSGGLGKNMMPLLPGLSGGGTLQTSRMAINNFPPFQKLVGVTKLQFLDNPALQALRAAFQIKDGRLFVQPFDVKLAGTTMNVSGSNGLDQSLQYALKLKVPRSLMGTGANEAISSLVSKAGAAGVNLAAAPEIPLGIQLGGTVTSPSVNVDLSSAATSVTETAKQAVQTAVEQKVDTVAQRLIREAEQQATAIRAEARKTADAVKLTGYTQADSIEAKATNPLLKAAAKPAADQLRKQADDKAAGIMADANKRADALVADARKQAGIVATPGQGAAAGQAAPPK